MVAAFVLVVAVGVAITIGVVRSIPPQFPNPTEAYEGIGDAFEALSVFCFGVGLSVLAGFAGAVIAGVWASGPRQSKTNTSDEN